MTFAVQAQLGFRNAQRRDAVSDAVSTRLAGLDFTLNNYTGLKGDPSLYVEVRFPTQVEADSFWANLQVIAGSGVNGPVTGSSFWRHDCGHDEGAPCVVAERTDL